jgi:threonine dehydrogenase-like Zn-dependent dehydrogenase
MRESFLRAIVYTAPGELRLLDVEEPSPTDNEAVIDVKAVGICGSELEGFASRSPFRQPPLIMGHEFAGVDRDTGRRVLINPVVACKECDLCLRGQANICRSRTIVGIQRPGGFAERVSVPGSTLYEMPDGMSYVQAALVEPLANAVHAHRLAQSYDALPQRVGIIGAGTLGLLTALVAQASGDPEVTITDRLDARLETAREAGVHTAAKELSGEFDVIFDAVGTAETRADSVGLLRPGGTSVWIGLHGPEAGFDGQALIRHEKRVLATFCYHDQDYKRAIEFARRLDTPWVETCPLEEGVDAFLGLLEAPSASVKTMLVP